MATQPDTLPCGAKRRDRYADPGWSCDGTGLIEWMRGPGDIAVVSPAWARDLLSIDPAWGRYHPVPFLGGDHYHAVVEPVVSKR